LEQISKLEQPAQRKTKAHIEGKPFSGPLLPPPAQPGGMKAGGRPGVWEDDQTNRHQLLYLGPINGLIKRDDFWKSWATHGQTVARVFSR
jgi:hypothetical protein